MSKTVQIDDDIYEFMEANARGLNQTVSTVLRRFLPLKASTLGEATSTNGSALLRFVADPAFRHLSATDRYLRILGFAYTEDPVRFEKLLRVSGKRRKYFGRSREEIDESGKDTQPRAIPGSSCWAMTNADTSRKSVMLRRALEILEYSAEDIRAAEESIL